MKPLFSYLFILLVATTCLAQDKNADKILGVWLTEHKDGKVEVFKSGNIYYGRLLWGNDMYEADGKTPRRDINNPDPKLRTRIIPSFIFLTNFTYKDDIWDGGQIYDARTGTSYDCYIKYVNENIEIRAFVGMHMFGRTETWHRIK